LSAFWFKIILHRVLANFSAEEITVAMKLSDKIRKKIELDIEYHGAAQTFYDHFNAKKNEYLPRILSKPDKYEKNWTQGQREAHALRGLIDSANLLSRGYSKRLAEDSPKELAYSASLYARLELWSGTRDECDEFLNFSA
jgi:hypothetical protein